MATTKTYTTIKPTTTTTTTTRRNPAARDVPDDVAVATGPSAQQDRGQDPGAVRPPHQPAAAVAPGQPTDG